MCGSSGLLKSQLEKIPIVNMIPTQSVSVLTSIIFLCLTVLAAHNLIPLALIVELLEGSPPLGEVLFQAFFKSVIRSG